jgi:hypothetical protein
MPVVEVIATFSKPYFFCKTLIKCFNKKLFPVPAAPVRKMLFPFKTNSFVNSCSEFKFISVSSSSSISVSFQSSHFGLLRKSTSQRMIARTPKKSKK